MSDETKEFLNKLSPEDRIYYRMAMENKATGKAAAFVGAIGFSLSLAFLPMAAPQQDDMRHLEFMHECTAEKVPVLLIPKCVVDKEEAQERHENMKVAFNKTATFLFGAIGLAGAGVFVYGRREQRRLLDKAAKNEPKP